MKENELTPLEESLHYTFKNKELLQRALTHKTFAFEAPEPLEYNERLELLGDSILNFVVAEQLYKTNKYFSEGELTRRRAMLVNNTFLAERAKTLNLGGYLLLGKGEQKQQGEKNPTNLANTLEALIGAIYLDSDMDTIKEIIIHSLLGDSVSF